jgi:Na+-driven multidrug efflux pump
MTVVGYFTAGPLLNLLGTDKLARESGHIFPLAQRYLELYYLSMLPFMV